MLTSGQLIAERYRLARRIAVGGMGEVWEAADTRLDRLVAVKVLKAELSGDAEFLHRFRTEARTTASLNHPGIASVHDYGETAAVPDGPQDTAYLVMELVEGEPLAGILASERRINAERTLDILEQAGHALQAAHERGLVHRDVKPGNILVAPNGTVKLTDFGIAKAADAAPVTRNGMVMGTAHYIAPEQALGHEAAPASDVYSLAVCGYECLAGQRPFLSDNAVTVAMMHIRDAPPPLPPDVPPHARAVIDATLVKDPKQRYGTGGEFANAIAAVRAGYALPAPLGLGGPGAAAGPGGPNGMAAPGIPAQAPAQPSLATQQAQQAQAQAQQAQAQLGQAQPGPPAMPSHPVPGMPGPQTGHHAPVAQPGTGAFPMSAPIPQPMPPARRAGRNTGWWVLLIVLALLLVVLGVVGLTVLANAAQTDRPHHPQASVGDDTGRRPTHGEGRNVFISEPSKYTLGSRA